jgi:hypothetical protein
MRRLSRERPMIRPCCATSSRRRSPAARVVVLLAACIGLAGFPATLAAQAAEPAARRDPFVASAIAVVIPGGGHYYAGELRRAAAVGTVFTAGFLLVGSSWRASDDCRAPDCDPTGIERRGRVGMTLIAGAYLFSLVDASLAARRQNRVRATAGAPAASIITRDGAPGIELRVPVRF